MPIWTEGVSVIIPTLNATEALAGLLTHLRGCEVLEVVVCDFGSLDDTVATARTYGANIVRGQNDPAGQVNAAIKNLRGTALWFLSPNARPPRLGAPYIIDILSDPDFRGGYFPLQYWKNNNPRRLSSWKANSAASVLGHVSLDHGPYVDHATLEDCGGYPDGNSPIPTMMKTIHAEGSLFVMPEVIRIVSDPIPAPHTDNHPEPDSDS